MRFWKYVTAAFNARPLGIFVPPNWIGLGVFGFLGWLNPGFWIVGAGLELAYLFGLSTSDRFRSTIDGAALLEARKASEEKVNAVLTRLDGASRRRYQTLADRCQEIIRNQTGTKGDVLNVAQGLDGLLKIYLRLLSTSHQLSQMVTAASVQQRQEMERRLAELRRRASAEGIGRDLQTSLEGQAATLETRLTNQKEAVQKYEFTQAEIQRIEEQVELVREQSTLSTEPVTVSRHVDAIASTLSSTNQWMKDQVDIFGPTTDELSDAGPILAYEQEK